MSWKAHGSKELAFERLVERIIQVVQTKYPHLSRDEAMQSFIDAYRKRDNESKGMK